MPAHPLCGTPVLQCRGAASSSAESDLPERAAERQSCAHRHYSSGADCSAAFHQFIKLRQHNFFCNTRLIDGLHVLRPLRDQQFIQFHTDPLSADFFKRRASAMMASSVAGSSLKPSCAEKRRARRIRSASSLNRSVGFPTQRMTLRCKSLIPSNRYHKPLFVVVCHRIDRKITAAQNPRRGWR